MAVNEATEARFAAIEAQNRRLEGKIDALPTAHQGALGKNQITHMEEERTPSVLGAIRGGTDTWFQRNQILAQRRMQSQQDEAKHMLSLKKIKAEEPKTGMGTGKKALIGTGVGVAVLATAAVAVVAGVAGGYGLNAATLENEEFGFGLGGEGFGGGYGYGGPFGI